MGIQAYSGQILNENKIVEITSQGKPWTELFLPAGSSPGDFFAAGIAKRLVLDKDITVNASSKFEPALKNVMDKARGSSLGKAANFLTKGSQIAGTLSANSEGDRASALAKLSVMPPNVRYQTSLVYLPAWESTAPMELDSITFHFHMGICGEYDGRTEVYNPVIALASVNLPKREGESKLRGPLPSVAVVYGQLAAEISEIASAQAKSATSGMNAQDIEAAFDKALGGVETKMEAFYTDGFSGVLNIRIGTRLDFELVTVAKTSYTFSQETDDNGYPIKGSVTWSNITTCKVPTVGDGAYQLRRK
jgi:hypothetical protein